MVHQTEELATCESMPRAEVYTEGVSSFSWWLLCLVFASIALDLIFCLGCCIYVILQKRAALVNIVQAMPLAAAAAALAAACSPTSRRLL